MSPRDPTDWYIIGAAALLILFVLAASSAYAETWCGIEVTDRICDGKYDSHEWTYPHDLDQRYGLKRRNGLGIPAGYFSPYDGRSYPSHKSVDIEHLRSRHSAHKAGGCEWSGERKLAYARDPLNITIAPPRINQHEKSDKDPDEWMPDENRRWFAWRYIAVSQKYGLSVTPATRDALSEVLDGRCP